MSPETRTKSIQLALIGCVCIGLFFWVVDKSSLLHLLKPRFTQSDVLELAQEMYRTSEFVRYDFPHEVDLNLDEDLLNYAQIKSVESPSKGFFPIASWEVIWRGEVETKEGVEDALFSVRYDFQGNLVELEQQAPFFNRPPNFEESEALDEANAFLQRLGIDPTDVTLKNKIINKEEQVLNYDFVFTRPSPIAEDLSETYDVHISGRTITDYRAHVTFDSEDEIYGSLHETSRSTALIATLLVWIAIGVLIIATFIRKLKHDELEYKRALWLAGLAALVTWGYIALNTWPNTEEMLMGGGLSALFAGIGMLIFYSAAESLNRDVWPERLALTDTMVRGFFRIRELGKTLLDALFITGVTLLTFAGLAWLAKLLNLGYVTFESDVLWLLEDTTAATSALLRNVNSMLFTGLILFLFGLTYLKSKLRNPLILKLSFAFILVLAGLHFYYLRPSHFSAIILFPLALLWAHFSVKHNFLALLLAFFTTKFLTELSLIGLTPAGWLSLPGIGAASFLFVILISGVCLVYSKRSVKDFEDYVPEYVSRIAERERFLKELEIARNVQMRFLPQFKPHFPSLDIASICRPAMEVGGDYYDFILNGEHALGIVIGDVSGKGVSAAFYMTMAKGILKTLSKTRRRPKEMLSEMNSIFYENVPRDIFISVIYGLFDINERVLRFARAGHNPLIVRKRSSGAPEFMHPKGIAIGLEKGPLFSSTIEEQCIPIEPGDIFVFFTDGISESMNKKGEEFGEENLYKIICESGNLSAQQILDKISDEVAQFTGQTMQHDDFTMVVVKINGTLTQSSVS